METPEAVSTLMDNSPNGTVGVVMPEVVPEVPPGTVAADATL